MPRSTNATLTFTVRNADGSVYDKLVGYAYSVRRQARRLGYLRREWKGLRAWGVPTQKMPKIDHRRVERCPAGGWTVVAIFEDDSHSVEIVLPSREMARSYIREYKGAA